MHATEAQLARAHTKQKLKITLPGPMTIVDTIADSHYGDKVKMAMAFAELLNQEARALEEDGVDVIQFDEPAFNVYMDDVKRWGIDALHRADRRPEVQDRRAHLLRLRHQGEPRLEGDARRASGASTRRSSRRSRRAASTRCRSSARNSQVPAELMALLKGKDVLVGVIDVATDEVETPEEVAATIERSAEVRAEASASIPAPTAAWRRWTATSPSPSSRRSRPAPRSRASGSDSPVSTADPALVDDLVVANRILYAEGVVDGFGHISARHPGHANRFLLARSMAPALVEAGDIMEFDLDGNAAGGDTRRPYLERFIHGAIYKARPDVTSVVHSHSPSVIPFGVTGGSLRPIYHMSGFLGGGAPIFEIREAGGMTDMLIRDNLLGDALARTLGSQRGGADARPRLGRGRQLDPAGRVPGDLHRDERAPADGGDAARHDQLPRA